MLSTGAELLVALEAEADLPVAVGLTDVVEKPPAMK